MNQPVRSKFVLGKRRTPLSLFTTTVKKQLLKLPYTFHREAKASFKPHSHQCIVLHIPKFFIKRTKSAHHHEYVTK